MQPSRTYQHLSANSVLHVFLALPSHVSVPIRHSPPPVPGYDVDTSLHSLMTICLLDSPPVPILPFQAAIKDLIREHSVIIGSDTTLEAFEQQLKDAGAQDSLKKIAAVHR